MSTGISTAGLSLEQAPPLEIPLSFFLTAPFAIALAGALLLMNGNYLLLSPWSPRTLALTHLGTLGFLTMTMVGALYQMTPVVVGSRIPGVRLAHSVHFFLVGGLCLLVAGLTLSAPRIVFYAIALLNGFFLFFLVPVGWALARAPTANDTVRGMRLTLFCFFLTVLTGIWMAHGHSGMHFPGTRNLWIQVHLSFGLLGWVGGLILAVSWQILPMFYLTPNFSKRAMRRELILLGTGLLLPPIALALDYFHQSISIPLHIFAACGALPAIFVVWILHPILALRNLAARRRSQPDASFYFWRAALAVALLATPISVLAFFDSNPRWEVLLIWLVIWGWAGMIIHGMLTRIVPFLIWFHRFSPLIGRVRVPSVRNLLPDAWIKRGFLLHTFTLFVGCTAILSRWDWAARLMGLFLLATAIDLAFSLLYVARKHPPKIDTNQIGTDISIPSSTSNL